MTSEDNVFAVGVNSTILHYDGNDWSQMENPGNHNLLDNVVWFYGVWASASVDAGTGLANDVFTVGAGTILHYDGTTWTIMKPAGEFDNSVTDLEFHSQNYDVLYAGTDLQGVYVSPNQAGKWLNLGTPAYKLSAISIGSLYAATEGGLLQCTGTGLIAGRITDASTGKGLDGATVYTDFGGQSMSVAGEFMLVNPAGNFTVTAISKDYKNITEQVTVSGGDVSWTNFNMESGYPDPWRDSEAIDTSSSGSYCFITTAACGSPLVKQGKVLRPFRDRCLLPHTIKTRFYPAVGLAGFMVSISATIKGLLCLGIVIGALVVIRVHQTNKKIAARSPSGHTIHIMLMPIFAILMFTASSIEAATLFQSVGVASSPNPIGSGARAVGMGGAFIGVADDATAASWNPAGLIQLERPELSIVADYNKRNISSSCKPKESSSRLGPGFFTIQNHQKVHQKIFMALPLDQDWLIIGSFLT